MLRGCFPHLASMILSKLHKMWSKLAVEPISLSLSYFVNQFLIHWSAWWYVSKVILILSQALSGSVWLTFSHSGSLLLSLWLTLAHSCSLSDLIWLTLALSDPLWLTLAHLLPLALSLTHSGSLLLLLNSLWLSQALIFLQDPCWARYVEAAKPQLMSWGKLVAQLDYHPEDRQI